MIRLLALLLFAPSAFAATVCTDFPLTFDGGAVSGPACSTIVTPPPPPSGGNCQTPRITSATGSHSCSGWPGDTMPIKTGSGGCQTNYCLNNLLPGREVCLEDGSGIEPNLSIGVARTREGYLEDMIYFLDNRAVVQNLVVGVDARRIEIRGQINGSVTVTGADVIINGQCYNGTAQ